MIAYLDTAEEITLDQLAEFFVGWPNPPDPATHQRLLRQSAYVVLAVDDGTGQVAGFITAISDGVLSAYIPLLEVLPAYRRQGIGGELVRRMLAKLEGLYMVDLLCEPELQSFYTRFGLRPASGMLRRDYARQVGG